MIRKVMCLFMIIIVTGVCGCVVTIEKTGNTEKETENTSKSESAEKKDMN